MRTMATVRLRGEAHWYLLRGLYFFLLVLNLALVTRTISAQSAGDYRSAATGTWNEIAAWETYTGLFWIPAVSAPTSSDGVITIRSGHILTVTVNVAIDQVVVASGGQVNTSTGDITVANGAGIDITVSGTIDNAKKIHLAANAEGVLNSGAVFINRAQATLASNASYVFNDGSTYEHAQNEGNLLKAAQTTWNAGSTCVVTGSTDKIPKEFGHTFHHFTWNSTGQTSTLNLAGVPASVNGDFSVVSTGSATLSYQQNTTSTFTISGGYVQSGGIFLLNDGTGSATLDVAGDVSISGGELRMTSGSGTPAMNVAGAFSHTAGTITETGTGTGTIVFDGAGNQTLTFGGTLSNDIDFDVNNSSDVTLASDFTPPQTLTLTTGNIVTGSNTVIVTSAATFTPGSNFIAGALRQTYTATGSKVFAVGTAGGYAPVTINVTAGTGDVTVRAVDGIHPQAGSPDALERYWTLTGPTITSADLTFEYLDTDIPGGADESAFVIGKYDGSWSFPGGSVDPVTNTATLSGITSFSDWSLGELAALPVELIVFDAQADGDAVLLRWATASETNNAGFEIQSISKKDGAAPRWEALAFVDGHGTTEEAQAYTYRTEALAPGRHVFRLKQIDYDGTFEYHPEVEVFVEMAERFVVEPAYPNPFNPQAQLRFAVNRDQAVAVVLYDVLGRQVAVLYEAVAVAGQMQVVEIDGSGLPSGLYLVRVVGERFAETQAVMLLQ